MFFYGKIKTATIQPSLWGNIYFAIRPQFPGSQKKCFLRFSELCKDTPRKHCTIPWEERTVESALWVLNAVAFVTQIRWNSTVRWLPSEKWQAACFFQNSQELDQSCCSNEVKTESVCFSGRLETENILPPQVENIAFIIRANFPSSQNHVSWLFQSCVKTQVGLSVPFQMR